METQYFVLGFVAKGKKEAYVVLDGPCNRQRANELKKAHMTLGDTIGVPLIVRIITETE